MKLFKCKMCGGALEISGETVVTCQYCGTQQTLPKLDDDKRANMYDRANHFRRNNEFDKAMGIYEQILNEDKTDAEAYWSLVLCRYGIEYVEDPASHKRIPTVNRAQFTSIFDDTNYKSALQYADSYQRSVYETEAKAINEIQKGILAISQKEEPFDVFICYKETDNNGRRTPDSVLATDLYHQLIQEGFKVFFSRITLEDKLGSAYEPYIFAALNSAKVMVVLGTKPEYFNAVWVKNEWSRYLGLIKQGAPKMLIPAYKDMDPYDLPEEFSHLQAQDMSKLGFMQDLIRGIKKIAQVDEPKETVVKETVVTGGAVNTAPLLKRAFMFLEDGEFNRADDFCEQVLNIDPECAEAYLGKLMAELQVRTRERLMDCTQPFSNNNNYQKVLRFGTDSLREEVSGYVTFIVNRNKETVYAPAVQKMRTAKFEDEWNRLASAFRSISDYKDAAMLATKCADAAKIAQKDSILESAQGHMRKATEADYSVALGQLRNIKGYKNADDLAEKCKEAIEVFRKDSIYKCAVSRQQLDSIKDLEAAIRYYEQIPEYEDASAKIEVCRARIEELKVIAEEKLKIAEEKRIAEERAAEERRIANAIRWKKIRKIAMIVFPIAVVIIAFLSLLNPVIIPSIKYSQAEKKMATGEYEAAAEIYSSLDDFRDSIMQKQEAMYLQAMIYYDAKDFTKSNDIFYKIYTYKDSREKIHKHEYAITATKEATCAEAGEITHTCKTCGDEQVEKLDKLEHSYTSEVTRTATCTVAGEITYTCACGNSYTEGIAATGHSHTSKITKAATCTASGTKTFSCACGDKYTESISALGHSMSAATCTQAAKCSRCKTTGKAALGHSWNKDLDCTRCSASYPSNITITARNLPYTTIDNVVVKTFSIVSKDPYTSFEGVLSVDVVIRITGISYSDWPETVYFYIYDSKGQKLDWINHDFWVSNSGEFSVTTHIYIPANDNYKIEFRL